MTQEDARQMRADLDTLGTAITTRLQRVRQLFGKETRSGAVAPRVGSPPPPAQQGAQEANSSSEPHPSQSTVAKEIDALGERLKSWISRTDEKYRAHARQSEHRHGSAAQR
jgi:hypothetical protein